MIPSTMRPQRSPRRHRDSGTILVLVTAVVATLGLGAMIASAWTVAVMRATERHEDRLRSLIASDAAARWITQTFPTGAARGCDALDLPPDPDRDLVITTTCSHQDGRLHVTVSARSVTHVARHVLEILPSAETVGVHTVSASIEPDPARTNAA